MRLPYAVVVLLVLGLGSCSQAETPPAKPGAAPRHEPRQNPGGPKMPAFQVTIAPQNPEAIVGESLNVAVTLKNLQEGPVEVVSADTGADTEFLLEPVGAGQEPRVLSSLLARAKRSDDPLPQLPVAMTKLGPGEEVVYREDLSFYAVEPLKPGRYRLSVSCPAGGERHRSPAVPIAIVPPRVQALALAPGAGLRRLGMVFAHDNGDKSLAIFQRESAPNKPADGISYRRATLKPPAVVSGVATSMDFGVQWEGRWYAWLHDGRLSAGVAQGHVVFTQLEPVALGLTAPTLHGAGWQSTVETATFVALGANAKGRPTLAAATFEAKGTAAVKASLLAAPAVPTLWAAARHMKADPPRYTIVWAAPWKEATRVQRQYPRFVEADTEPDALTLLETPGPVRALALAPVADAGVDTVDALVGGSAQDRRLTLYRLPIDGGEPKGKWTFAAPAERTGETPTAYTLLRAPVADPPVLAKLGATVLLCRVASGGGWVPLAENAPRADHLRLETIKDGSIWAIWADPDLGIQYKRLP